MKRKNAKRGVIWIWKGKALLFHNPINPIWERSCPRNSKNVTYVDVGLVQTCLDLIESWGWGGGVGGLSKNLVKPSA